MVEAEAREERMGQIVKVCRVLVKRFDFVLKATGGAPSNLKPPITVWGTWGLPMAPSFNAITVGSRVLKPGTCPLWLLLPEGIALKSYPLCD